MIIRMRQTMISSAYGEEDSQVDINRAESFLYGEEPVLSEPEEKTGTITDSDQNIHQDPFLSKSKTIEQKSPIYNQVQMEGADNKVIVMAAYLLGIMGIIIALLAAPSSEYVAFHVRQAIKFSIITALLVFLAIPCVVLSMIPYLGIIFQIVLWVLLAVLFVVFGLRIWTFVQVYEGKAKNQ